MATPIETLRARVEELRSSIDTLSAVETITPEDDARLSAELDEFEARTAEYDALVARAARVEAAKARVTAEFPTVVIRKDIPTVEETRGFSPAQLVDAVTRSIEERGNGDVEEARRILKRHTKGDPGWARNLLARSSEIYQDAWVKVMTGRSMELSNEERAAIAVGTNTQGGYLVPTHLDPTIILTSSASNNAIRRISRIATLTREKTWNGVASTGVTASWDGELVEVSDDSPGFTAPTVATHQAQAFVQASFAAFEDIEGLAGDVMMMFADAKDRLEGAAYATGTGSGQPKGIFTACDANTNVEFTSLTAATLALADLTALRRSVPVRYRGNTSWVMNPVYADAIRALGTAVSASFSTDITGSNTDMLLGRPVYETDDAPSTQTTTVRDNEIIVGDFSQFLIVDKPGSTAVEFIPQLFATANNLPDGRRGWFMHWRTGSDATNVLAFALLQDKTSA